MSSAKSAPACVGRIAGEACSATTSWATRGWIGTVEQIALCVFRRMHARIAVWLLLLRGCGRISLVPLEVVGHPVDRGVDQGLVDQLDHAFNESTVCGLLFDRAGEARLLVEVLALPETGPLDPDPRRAVVFTDVSSVTVILRANRTEGLGPAIPVATVEELEEFFASLTHADAMYGWSFIDVEEPGEDWNGTPSLELHGTRQAPTEETMHWFTECGRPTSEDWESYTLQGLIQFGGIRIERADSRPVFLGQFVDDARRWWDAFGHRDSRLSAEAQQQAEAQSTRWRTWGGTSVMVPGRAP